MKRYIEAGRLNSPRGIKGEVRFACYCDSPEFLSGVKRLYLDPNGEKSLEIVLYRPSIPSITFKGYEQRELASLLNGRTVWFDRNDVELPEGTFYFSDLIGEPVYNVADGNTLPDEIGVIEDVEEGIGSFYYIVDGKTRYRVPAVERYVVSAQPGKGVFLRLDEGLAI